VRFGSQANLTAQKIAELQDQRRQGAPIRALMKDYRISKATIYRYLHGVSPAHPQEPHEFV
jgi:hypothetical protein